MRRALRHCLAVAVVAAPLLLPRAAGAQATFTWEGLNQYDIPAAQAGVAAGGYFQATNSGAPNVFGGVPLNCNVTSGGSMCGYNGAATQVNLHSVAVGGTFTFNSGYFMSLPAALNQSNSATSLTVTGYDPSNVQIFSQMIALSSSTPTLTTFNWTGVNKVTFDGNGAFGSGNAYFLADDVTVNAATITTTPEPSSIALLGTGMVGLVPMMRRRRR